MFKYIFALFALIFSLSAISAPTKDSTSVIPRDLSWENCSTTNQKWYVSASSSGVESIIQVMKPKVVNGKQVAVFEDVDISHVSENCRGDLVGYNSVSGNAKAKFWATTGDYCKASFTVCTSNIELASCTDGSDCNSIGDVSTDPDGGNTTPPTLCPAGSVCACGGDIVFPAGTVVQHSGGGYRVNRFGRWSPWTQCP